MNLQLTPAQEAAAERFDRHMIEATGHTLERYNRVRAVGPTALAHVQLFGCLVDESGAAEALERWAAEDRKSNAGRKPFMSFRAALILHLMHTDAGANRYNDVARTLYARLTPETFEYLGITVTTGTQDDWYMRYWKTLNRILALTSPWEVPRNTFLSAEAFRRAVDSYSQERRDRMDEVMNRLAHASIRRLPREIRATYRGNIALDATPVKLAGRPNPRVSNLDSARSNLDAMSGPYTRRGKHKGSGKRKDDAAWEVETVVTVANAPGQADSFPVLTSGLTMHQPGHIKAGPLIALKFHAELFSERGYVMVDRAYNNLKSHRFQNPARMMGFRLVLSYKKKRTAKAASVEDAILVDGCLYVKWMPKSLVEATFDYQNPKSTNPIDVDTYRSRLRNRAKYRLMEKGRPDSEGRQRFSYPSLRGVMCVDPVTQNKVTPKLKKTTLTLAPDNPEAMLIIKSLQSFEYRSDKWAGWMGLRSHVEANNRFMKDESHAALGDANRRRPRGYAFQALAVASAAAVSNMRRIVNFIEEEVKKVLDPKTLRARRRRDEHGNRLEHPTEVMQLRQ